MDFQFIKTYAPMYVEAAKLTMSIALLGILLSTLVGFICCLIRYYKIPILQRVIGMYIELSRNTPLLIQLFFLYFGLPKLGIFLSSYACGVLGLTFLGGSYMAEAFRSGLESIPDIQMESGLSLGLTKWQVLCYIIFPQAVAVSLPAFSANVIFLIKETSVFSVVALAGLIGLYYKTDESLLMLVVAYLVLLLPISLILSVIEKKVRYGGVGN